MNTYLRTNKNVATAVVVVVVVVVVVAVFELWEWVVDPQLFARPHKIA